MALDPDKAKMFARLVDAKDKMSPSDFDSKIQEQGLNAAQREIADRFFETRLETLSRDFPGTASQEILDLFETLKKLGVSESVRFDPKIMRGLDYYTGVVFEAFDISPENNRALFGGGRYDNLLGLFSKNELSGTGFGLGDVTLQNFLETHGLLPSFSSFYDLYCVCGDEAAWVAVQQQVREWRAEGARVLMPLTLSSFKAQFKEADRFKVPFTLIVGTDELASGLWSLKDMATGEQFSVKPQDILSKLRS